MPYATGRIAWAEESGQKAEAAVQTSIGVSSGTTPLASSRGPPPESRLHILLAGLGSILQGLREGGDTAPSSPTGRSLSMLGSGFSTLEAVEPFRETGVSDCQEVLLPGSAEVFSHHLDRYEQSFLEEASPRLFQGQTFSSGEGGGSPGSSR